MFIDYVVRPVVDRLFQPGEGCCQYITRDGRIFKSPSAGRCFMGGVVDLWHSDEISPFQDAIQFEPVKGPPTSLIRDGTANFA